MSDHYKPSRLIIAAAATIALLPAAAQARNNTLTAGLQTSYDYEDRQYDSVVDDPETIEIEAGREAGSDDDYNGIAITPLLLFKSLSGRDALTISVAPTIKYDFDDEETDWDSNFLIAAERMMTRAWGVNFSNQFLRSDYHDPDRTDFTRQELVDESGAPAEEAAIPSPETATSEDPELSGDLGRKRYWRNTLNLGSDYEYRLDSRVGATFSYIVLRNDDDGDEDGVSGYDDYDRYAFGLNEQHRFSRHWRAALNLSYVIGDYDEADNEIDDAVLAGIASDANLSGVELTEDLEEYHLLFTTFNESIIHNPLSLSYSYAGTRYDEPLRGDHDIHELRFVWKREFSPAAYTQLGIGPSYVEVDGQDDDWGGNGIAEFNYRTVRSSFNFLVEKDFTVDNFSGTNERGVVDTWTVRLGAGYNLQKDLLLSANLAYVSEDRQTPTLVLGEADGIETVVQEDYSKERYIAGAGMRYTFWRYYSASLGYTYTTQDSDLTGEDYDDHRVLLSLGWQKEVYRW